MKKLLLIGLAIIGISSMAYASYAENCNGANRFIENLDLDEARAYEVSQVLSSYGEIKGLAMRGEHDQIPVFLEQKEAELAEVLTEEELLQFKENVGEWAEGKDFSKFQKFSEMNFGWNK